jgi:hypothetical protein
VGEAKKVEQPAPAKAGVSGLPSPRSFRFCAAKRPNRIKRVFSPRCIGLVLKADDDVVSVSHHDDVSVGLLATPAISPQVEDVMQVDVRQ